MKSLLKMAFLFVIGVDLVSFVSAAGQEEGTRPPEPQKGEAARAVGPAKIEFWTEETQSDRMSTIQLLVDTFTAKNPGVQITLVPVDENDIAKQVASAAAAGTLPSVAEMASESAMAFGSEGIMDANAATDLVKSMGKEKFYSGSLLMLETPQKGSYYAVPHNGWIQGIWYRSDWFKEARLAPPTTWDAIEKAAKYFHNPQNNLYGVLVGTKAEVYTEQCFTQIAISNKARLFDANGKLIFNSLAMKEAIEYYAGLAKYNPPGPQTWRARDYYLQGKMAMFFYSTYIMDDLALQEEAAGSLTNENFADLAGADFDPKLAEKTGFAPIITNKQPSSYGVIYAMGLFKQKDPAKLEAAKKFVAYLFTDDAYVTFLHMAPGGMNPVIKNMATSPKFMNDDKGIFKRYGTEKMGQINSGMENIMRFGIVDGKLIESYGKIFSQQIIPQMIYKITQENMPVDGAMGWAEEEMKKAGQ